MMTSDIVRAALYGLFRVLFFDASGLGYFEDTLAGFWRAFRLVIVAVPLQMLFVVLVVPQMLLSGQVEGSTLDVSQTIFGLSLVQGMALVIGWSAYPLVMLSVVDWIGGAGHYYRYMVAYNWLQLGFTVVQVGIALLTAVGVVQLETAELLLLGVFITSFSYALFIARAVLRLHWTNALGIVILDFLLTRFISLLAVLLTKQTFG